MVAQQITEGEDGDTEPDAETVDISNFSGQTWSVGRVSEQKGST